MVNRYNGTFTDALFTLLLAKHT